jgi:hypothetical protein
VALILPAIRVATAGTHAGDQGKLERHTGRLQEFTCS